MIRLVLLAASAAALAACATSAPAPAAETPDAPGSVLPSTANDTCGAGLFKELLGKPMNGPGVPAESRVVRHITPGSRVTMDYIAQRMNIEADGTGTIRKINCG